MAGDHERGRGAIDAILGLHLRLAHGAVSRHFVRHFAHLALTQKQVSVLWLTGDRPGIAQTDLARCLRMDRATTMGIVHTLEARGLIRRGRDAGDRRRMALALTPTGEALLGEAKAAIAEHERWLCTRFTDAEVATLFALLRRIHEPESDDDASD